MWEFKNISPKSKGQSFGPFCGENLRAKANLLVRFAVKI